MNFLLKDLAFRSGLPPTPKFVLVAISQTMRDAKSDICKPSVALLSKLTGFTTRTIKREMAVFRSSGVLVLISRGRKGTPNVYRIDMKKLSTICAELGDTISPNLKCGDIVSPNPPKCGDIVSPNPPKCGDTMSPIKNTTLQNTEGVQIARAREAASAAAHTHTNSNSDDVFSCRGKRISAQRLAVECDVPLLFAKAKIEQWRKSEWCTTGDKPITPRNIKAHLVSWWESEDDKDKYLVTQADVKTVTFKPEEIKHAELLCREECKMYNDGKCKAGLLWSELRHKTPPRECEGNPDRKGGKAK